MIHDQIRELDAAAAVLSFDQKLDLGICLPVASFCKASITEHVNTV